MQRTQVLLEGWQYETLKALSAQRGESLSHVVREAVEVYLRQAEADDVPRLDEIEGIGSDRGASGRTHDDVLYGGKRVRR